MIPCGTGQRGFTLVELLIVIAIMGILLSIAVPNFSTMQKKAAIEQEVTTIYSNLMTVRLEALYSKTGRTVGIVGDKLSIYSSQDTTVPPISVITLRYPVSSANLVQFDSSGMMVQDEISICVDPSGTLADNPGNTDSVDVSAAKIHMGKRQSGGLCVPANIEQK